jgi:hypothetical protein
VRLRLTALAHSLILLLCVAADSDPALREGVYHDGDTSVKFVAQWFDHGVLIPRAEEVPELLAPYVALKISLAGASSFEEIAKCCTENSLDDLERTRRLIEKALELKREGKNRDPDGSLVHGVISFRNADGDECLVVGRDPRGSREETDGVRYIVAEAARRVDGKWMIDYDLARGPIARAVVAGKWKQLGAEADVINGFRRDTPPTTQASTQPAVP